MPQRPPLQRSFSNTLARESNAATNFLPFVYPCITLMYGQIEGFTALNTISRLPRPTQMSESRRANDTPRGYARVRAGRKVS
jgi:hypothetical protein